MNSLPVNLTIAGFDPSGGGGLQADLRVFTALKTHSLSVATAVTSQNSLQVNSVFPLPPEVVASQLRSLAQDFSLSSIKVGMVYCKETVEVLADSLREIRYNKLIIDPVLFSKGGVPLISEAAVSLLKERLFPLADLVTPNLE
ncbi:MAG: hydroxymethylpyrimidine/phosphomethylpyrimidine kinase, partial [bacterium]